PSFPFFPGSSRRGEAQEKDRSDGHSCGAASVRRRESDTQEIAHFRVDFACELYNVENATVRSRFTILALLILFGCAAAPVPRPWKLDLATSGGFTGRGSGSISIDSAGAIHVVT